VKTGFLTQNERLKPLQLPYFEEIRPFFQKKLGNKPLN